MRCATAATGPSASIRVGLVRAARARSSRPRGIEHFLDAKDLGTRGSSRTASITTRPCGLMARERGDKPLFVFTYTAANHFPWNFRYQPDLTPDWRDTGNAPRGRRISAPAGHERDATTPIRRAAQARLPGEPFLIVRFGDHQPIFAKHIVDPALDDVAIWPAHRRGRPALSSPPTTPSTRSTSARRTCRRRSIARCALPAAGRPGGRGRAARRHPLRSRSASSAVATACSIRCAQWRRGPALQPAADRCRPDQAALTMSLTTPSAACAASARGMPRAFPPDRRRAHRGAASAARSASWS